jgi:hypothetical protein
MPLKVFPKAIEQDFGPFTFPGLRVNGGNEVAVGGIGFAAQAVHGDNASGFGPHVQFTTDADNYPILAMYPWSHDDMFVLWDAYYDGSFRSSDAGSNFQFRKTSDQLRFQGSFGNALASAISWIDIFRLTSAGAVFNSGGNASIDVVFTGDTQAVLTIDAGTEQAIAGGFLNLERGPNLTVSGGVITATQSFHKVGTEGGAGTDDLNTINGGNTEDILLLESRVNAEDTTLKDGVDNLRLAGDFTLTNVADKILLIKRATVWHEICRSNNS